MQISFVLSVSPRSVLLTQNLVINHRKVDGDLIIPVGPINGEILPSYTLTSKATLCLNTKSTGTTK